MLFQTHFIYFNYFMYKLNNLKNHKFLIIFYLIFFLNQSIHFNHSIKLISKNDPLKWLISLTKNIAISQICDSRVESHFLLLWHYRWSSHQGLQCINSSNCINHACINHSCSVLILEYGHHLLKGLSQWRNAIKYFVTIDRIWTLPDKIHENGISSYVILSLVYLLRLAYYWIGF